MRIGDLAKICNVTIKTIRFYETKNLLHTSEVDRWTGYRYYNDESVKRLSEIQHLKSLGFSLKEIQNLNEEQIVEKTKQLKLQIKKLNQNINELNSISKNELGELVMKSFVNDEQVVGKWQKIAVVEKKEEYFLGKAKNNEEIFPYPEIYFLPQGNSYWVFSWTKGTLYLKDRKNPYEVVDDVMFVGVVDFKDGNIYNYAVYKKVDSKEYTADEIAIKDNINIPFVKDENAVGFWEQVDYVNSFENFVPNKNYWKSEKILKSYALSPNGDALLTFVNNNVATLKWSKGVIINQKIYTASEYTIKQIDGNEYMFVEWKSGDYVYGGKVYGYYVFKRI